jgi:ATP-dependent DNA helicase PIF1
MAQQHTSVLPDPELYIIVNGRPTKSNVVWRNLVDVKAAIRKLRSSNWLYRDVHEKCIDESIKHIIEVSNNATTELLKKVSPDEVDAFQAYTIRNLDSKLSIGSDIEQYRLMSITEDPITNKQQHLDVMCFPVLFPTGKFGEFHPRKEKISPSEYVKSRVLNKDSRFRKDAQYVFYLLWQKEMRQLASGVYNLLKSTRRQAMSVSILLEQVNTADEQLEARLCTMLQSVRGTKQFWFLRHSELQVHDT